MERLELSQPKLLEPKPSASTNSATSVITFEKRESRNKSLKNLKIYSSSTYTLYTKLVGLPRNIDFAKDKDF
jgi:hypothetical protein